MIKNPLNYWCDSWSFDDAKFERYVYHIRNNQAYFIFQNGEWKIDEN